MECHCLRASTLPDTSSLYAAYLDQFSRVAQFYSHPPTEEGLLSAAREMHFDSSTRSAVVEVLREQNRRFGSDAAAFRSLDRLAAGAVAVVSGQQVGLFGGPAYSFYKAVSAVRVAEHLTDAGIEAVPIFWLASEDHDLAEVNHTFWLGRGPLLNRFELRAPAAASGRSVGEVAFDDSVLAAVQSAVEAMEGPWREEFSAALLDAYRPGQTYGSAFGLLFARLFSSRGLVLLDPLDTRLHRIAAPLYRRSLDAGKELTAALLQRNNRLEHSGFHAQVKVAESATLLFFHLDGQRLPLRRRNRDFLVGKKLLSAEALFESLDSAPERFSPNVLLRPVVQDALLPTAAYISGPAEAAYLAQAEVIYRRLLDRMPAILPRAGFTLVEPHVARLLKKYSLEFSEVLRGRQLVRKKMEREALPSGLRNTFARGEKDLQKLLRSLRTPLSKLDPTLLGALGTAEKKMLYQFEKLRAKAGRAQNFRTGLLDQHEHILLDSLFPHHGLQERSLNLLPFLARHGRGLLDELLHRCHVRNAQHQVLFL
jgi:bacillithiol biosynthesis cysteine-adding enzyme BshC